jgi:hypothetical protein
VADGEGSLMTLPEKLEYTIRCLFLSCVCGLLIAGLIGIGLMILWLGSFV